ncbi:MAG: N-acetylglucosamine-6-phosphate deacetylase [Planctomycetota bacterium]
MNLLGRRYDTGEAVTLRMEAGRIAWIRPLRDVAAATLPWIAPGFVDLQINGYGGREFNEPGLDLDGVERIVMAQDACGVVAFCPTTTTHSAETLLAAVGTIAAACERSESVRRRVVGIHVEGPYISLEDGPRGAHPKQHVRPPDWDEFQLWQEAAGGRVRILTMSPEYEGSAEFIRRVVDSGTVVAIGHTNATSSQIRAAVDAGARFSTHLGNAAHPRIRRHPNYIWDQLADDRLQATLIVDGHHLPPSVVQSFVRAKTPDRCLIVSDITGMAGMKPGVYEQTSLGSIEVLEDGRLVVGGQRDLLAGASLPIGVGVVNLQRFAGLDLRTAVEMASVRPALLAGHPVTRLEAGAPANLIQFNLSEDPSVSATAALEIVATIIAGEVVYGRGRVA